MKLILLGAPGAGEGTQATVLSERLSIPILGTGNLLRTAVAEGTPSGLAAKEYMDRGDLVPDEIVVGVLQERLSQPDSANGYILDGFPRNLSQAETLKKLGVEVDRVINLHVKEEDIMRRMGGRRVCQNPGCGATYHIEYNPPKVERMCDVDGGTLIIREDDKPETVKDRLRVYHEETAPLIDYYTKQGILVTVEGQEELEDTTRLTLEALEAEI